MTPTARCGDLLMHCVKPTDVSAAIADFVHFQDPPAAHAYFRHANGPFGQDVPWPIKCKGGNTSTEVF